jgi:hypothetical protein
MTVYVSMFSEYFYSLLKFCQTSIIILDKDELFSWITQFLVPFSTFRGCPCLSGGWDGAVLVWRVMHSLHIMIKVHIFSHYVHLVLLENMLLFPAKINQPLHFDMKPYSTVLWHNHVQLCCDTTMFNCAVLASLQNMNFENPVLFFLVSSPGPKVHVNYCHHLASVVCRLSSVVCRL